jgi:hypothetical protein
MKALSRIFVVGMAVPLLLSPLAACDPSTQGATSQVPLKTDNLFADLIPKQQDTSPAAQSSQRYQIVFSPHGARDTFMIDTATGRVWQLTKYSFLNDEPVAWEHMERIDGDADYKRFVAAWGKKEDAGGFQRDAASAPKKQPGLFDDILASPTAKVGPPQWPRRPVNKD